MATRVKFSAGIFIVGLITGVAADAAESDSRAPAESRLRPAEGMIMLDYQVIRVPGDKPIDLMGFHVYNQVADWLYLGVGAYAPLVRGAYGGFMAFDVGAHVQQRLSAQVFATAGLSGGGGGGGKDVEQAKALSGTGAYFKGYVGLGYDFGNFAIGANVAKMKFRHSAINGTQANAFVEIPYTYFTGSLTQHGQTLSPADSRRAAEGSGESMLTLALDNFRQIRPEGSYKGTLNVADLQYAHFYARDTYWYAGLGVGYHGLPLYNQLLGGVGQRVRLSPHFSVYGQLGIGSGGYSSDLINTHTGLLFYPKFSAEYAVTPDLGLSLSAGYLAAPKGTSKNLTYGLALTHHLSAGGGGAAAISDSAVRPTYRGFRVSVFQQTDFAVRYRGNNLVPLQMLGTQVDLLVNDRWYLPLQAAVACNAYQGYPGYGELLIGIGVQTRTSPGERFQLFGQLLAGTNAHGPAVRANAGLRYGLSDRLALDLAAGRIEARRSTGQRFSANSLSLGLDYRFSIPGW
jgi:hypothetical protein